MLLKSINAWSFPGGLDGQLEVFEALMLAKEHGFPAIELCISVSGAFGLETTQSRCKDIRAEADRLGVLIPSLASGIYWERNLADSSKEGRQQARADLETMLQIASWLGAKTLLAIPGAVDVFFMPDRPVQDYATVHKWATEGLREVLPTAERCQVRMGIENVWNKFLTSPLEMAAFIDQFQSPWIGAYVDVGNILALGYPEQWLRILRHRVVGVHFKDFRRAVGTADGFVDLLEGDVDWPEVMQALREIEYSGPVVAEMIPSYRHHPFVRVANTSRAMDAILSEA